MSKIDVMEMKIDFLHEKNYYKKWVVELNILTGSVSKTFKDDAFGC